MEHMGQFIVNHWDLWVILIVVLLFIFINELIAQKKLAKELSPQATVALINQDETLLIDLRDKESFRKAHIINAINASADDFEQQRMDKYKSKPFILVCAKGLQSATLAKKLRTQGFLEPLVLAGGMTAWQAADFPAVKGK